jgi:hypothetical protein
MYIIPLVQNSRVKFKALAALLLTLARLQCPVLPAMAAQCALVASGLPAAATATTAQG